MSVGREIRDPLPESCRPFRGLIDQPLTDRIHILATEGLKVRDISSLLHIHPLIVMRVLNGSGMVSSKK